MVADEDGGTVSVAPATVSLAALVSPTTFAAWAVQGAVNGACICGMYASLYGATE